MKPNENVNNGVTNKQNGVSAPPTTNGVDHELKDGVADRHDVNEKANDGDALEKFPKEKTLQLRKEVLCEANQLFFREDPLKIVRGKGTFLYDEQGNEILDCINNVASVGHCHPEVVNAGAKQMGLLATNNRYLHDTILVLAKRLLETFAPLNPQLEVCLFGNSGSEVNDLALQMARRFTGAYDVMVIDHAYHGHLTTIMEMSPYKFKLPGGGGQEPHVHLVPSPDKYRGKFRDDEFDEEEISRLYLEEVKRTVEKAKEKGRRIACFFAETVQSCGGQIFFPKNWLKETFAYCKSEGIVTVADEVQVGFARTGSHFWSFQYQDAQPDVVTMGKPMGDGHPVSAVVFTRRIADAFAAAGVPYFNTFGGNPVSCAVALAVLDVIEREKLQNSAKKTGEYLMEELRKLKAIHPLIGDVRGVGLMAGVELVTDRRRRLPATSAARRAKTEMIKRRVLISTDGPEDNVLKIKPPLVFRRENVDQLISTLDSVLSLLEAEMASPASAEAIVDAES